MKLLKLRNLIAAREFNTACANRELANGGWTQDFAHNDARLAEQIAAMLAEPVAAPKCTWTYNEASEHWDGTCGIAWTMIDGRLLENHMHYCPRCGGKISEVV